MATAKDLLAELDSVDSKASAGSTLLAELSQEPATALAAPSQTKAVSSELPWHKQSAHGFMDQPVGAGQLAQHVLPERASNWLRSPANAASIAGVFPPAGVAHMMLNAASGGKQNVTTEEVDAHIAASEREYQSKRKEAGEEGIDWWRIGGSLANPMSWIGPTGPGAGLWSALRAGAKQGAFQALLQPVASEGNFIWDKATQAALGGAVGGTLGSALSLFKPALSRGARFVRETFGKVEGAKVAANAQRIVDEALGAAKVTPESMDPSLYSAMRREAADALKAGVDPDTKIIENYADAAALPVPVRLTRGRASGDPMQITMEEELAKLRGVGEELNQSIVQNNRALIESLNELGARNAPSQFDASQKLISHLEGVDEQLRGQINAAYSKVRNSAGRSATVSTEGFAQAAKNKLTDGNPELAGLTSLADYLPETIARQYNDIVTGKLPLTVDAVQFLDRAWGGVARGSGDDTTRNAINKLRSALNDAPIDDAVGKESMEAYKVAKTMAAQRFGMIEANPAYKAVTDGVEPDKFFQKYVQGANVSELAALKQLIGAENTGMLQQTLIGNLKRQALNNASDEVGSFSQAAYNKVLQDPVQGPRLRELFKDSPKTLDQLYRVGRVAERVIKAPKGSAINTSNTASAGANLVRDIARSETGSLLAGAFPRIAGVGRILKDAGAKVQQSQAVRDALEPGVTTRQVPKKELKEVRLLSDLLTRSGAIGVTKTATEREE